MQVECLRAQVYLQDVGIQAEVIDPIWLSPLDTDTIAESVARTRRLLVVDNGWLCCGASAEIIAAVTERLQGNCEFRVGRLGFAPATCPTSPGLESLYYPNGPSIAGAARNLIEGTETGWLPEERTGLKNIVFKGPF
jgi:pyruvate/2-oxoglutarate/acetoin dehydrogenase E1 component